MKRDTRFNWHRIAVSDISLTGKKIAVIGGTGGIGRALSRAMASRGASVIVVGQTFRDAEITGIEFISADLSLLSEARRVAALLPADKLDMVVFTTGIFAARQRQETPEGIERDMAVSYLNRQVILQTIAPTLGQARLAPQAKPRVFIMGYPGAGQTGNLDDLNSEKGYSVMKAHMNTVAGNEALVLDVALRYPQLNVFGLNPGLIKSNIRQNVLSGNQWLFRFIEGMIGLLSPTAETYAARLLPLLTSPDLSGCSGLLFNRSGQAILPSPGLTPRYVEQFMLATAALIEKARPPTPDSVNTSPNKESPMSLQFDPIQVGPYHLSNRLVMAPMTRSRAQVDGTPGPLAAEYYAQRASIGLIVTEGTQPSDDGQGYLTTPGIYTDAHVEGWRKVTSAVHAKGGRIFIQLMHAGRMSHPDNTPHHRLGVAPSAIAPDTGMFTASGMQAIPTPRALTIEEIHQTVADFRFAARKAIDAGADGVEIHGANAYLIQQFFAPSANTRTDEYGGSIENRARFALEVVSAIIDEISADKTAIRLSPGTTLWGIDEGKDGPDLYRYLVAELNKLGLVYLHIMHQGNETLLGEIRQLWKPVLIVNRPSRPRDEIGADLVAGRADLEAYGQMVLANPDFVARLKAHAPLNEADRNTFFGGNAQGYTDYPFLPA